MTFPSKSLGGDQINSTLVLLSLSAWVAVFWNICRLRRVPFENNGLFKLRSVHRRRPKGSWSLGRPRSGKFQWEHPILRRPRPPLNTLSSSRKTIIHTVPVGVSTIRSSSCVYLRSDRLGRKDEALLSASWPNLFRTGMEGEWLKKNRQRIENSTRKVTTTIWTAPQGVHSLLLEARNGMVFSKRNNSMDRKVCFSQKITRLRSTCWGWVTKGQGSVRGWCGPCRGTMSWQASSGAPSGLADERRSRASDQTKTNRLAAAMLVAFFCVYAVLWRPRRQGWPVSGGPRRRRHSFYRRPSNPMGHPDRLQARWSYANHLLMTILLPPSSGCRNPLALDLIIASLSIQSLL